MRILNRCWLLTGVALIAAVNTCSAQWVSTYRDPGYHASTAAEGYQRGTADVMRSAGARNLMNSQAAINATDARSNQLDNNLKTTQTYFEKQQINKSYQASQQKPPATREQLARYAAAGTPSRMSVTQLDPVTGKIDWPATLMAPTFAQYRQPIDKLFEARTASEGSIGPGGYADIRSATTALLDALKSHVTEYPPNVYISARKFIESLSYEASFASG